MSNRINKISLALLASLLATTAALASDVYIDQAGSNSTIDITQTGDGNTVGSDATASTITGDNSDVDITQTGATNTADVLSSVGTSGTILDYTATGSNNVLEAEIDGAADTKLTATITGDSNELTLCGTLGTDAATAASATCATGVQADTTDSTVAITGSSNKVAIAAGAAEANNEITIGANVSSSFNIVNLKQSGSDTPNVILNMDGDSNAVNITQN